MKKILIISHDEDGTSNLLMSRLREMDHPYALIDISDFPRNGFGTVDYSGSDPYFLFEQNGETISTETVKSVWWRRPAGKIRAEPDSSIEKYIRMESDMFVRSLFYMLPSSVKWVSDPDATRIANSKPLQLQIAKAIGLRIPRTLISNSPEDVRKFVESNSDIKIIMKPVGSSFCRATDREGGNRTIYTRIVNQEELLKNIDRVRNCPTIFQEAMVNKIDLRSTVIEDRVFTVSITHERDLGAGADNLDWRNHKLERIYKPFELPINIQTLLVEIVQRLKLRFGVVDLCLTEGGEYCFFEVNPQGQWIPSEMVAGHPISKTLAMSLASC